MLNYNRPKHRKVRDVRRHNQTAMDQNVRKDVLSAYEKQSLQLDNIIITVASGTILLTVTFFEKIINQQNIIFSWMLKTCWSLLIICIISVLISYRLSKTNFEIALAGKQISRCRDCLVSVTDYIAIISLIGGLIFAIAFGWASIDIFV